VTDHSLDSLKPILEAILFAASEPLPVAKIREATGNVDVRRIRRALDELQKEYESPVRGFRLEEIAGGYQLLSKKEYQEQVSRLSRSARQVKLSAAALETLSIIAYKQPIGRAEIENIRGVQASPILHSLLELDLIKIAGREEVIGRPFLYGTTARFLKHFGLKSLGELPPISELPSAEPVAPEEAPDQPPVEAAGEAAEETPPAPQAPDEPLPEIPQVPKLKDVGARAKEILGGQPETAEPEQSAGETEAADGPEAGDETQPVDTPATPEPPPD